MKKQWLFIALSIVIAVMAIVFTANTVKSLKDYRVDKEAIAEELNFKERVMSTAEWMPFNEIAETKMLSFQNLHASATEHYSLAVWQGVYLVLGIIVYILFTGLYYKTKPNFSQMFGIALILSSLCLIYVGLQAPFLEIEAFSTDLAFQIPIDLGFWEQTFEKTFDGKISYFYQNKSVFQLIYLLFTGGNVVVGIALVLFSVVFPLFKLLTSLFVLLFPSQKHTPLLTQIILWIGKWSMADVFVAGIFLAYFSFTNMNVGVETTAQTLIGLYFFLGFVILSILSSYFVKKVSQSQ